VEGLQSDDPSQIGPYRLLGCLGKGGMGKVYLGASPGGRKVAIKVVHPHFADDPEYRRRFAREVAAARQVGGFHTALVVDADPRADPPWMATAYIAGPSVADAVIRQGPLDEARVHELGGALAEGLIAIHACGLIHRDLKPANVILGDDGPRILDFGIAKAADTTALTGSQAVLGTLRYMSPEQLHAWELTPQSDVFALGALLTYAATGHDPFEGPTIPAVLNRILNCPPNLAPLAGDLYDIISACLAKDPRSRPSPSELLVLFNPLNEASASTTAASPASFRADASGPKLAARQDRPPRSTSRTSTYAAPRQIAPRFPPHSAYQPRPRPGSPPLPAREAQHRRYRRPPMLVAAIITSAVGLTALGVFLFKQHEEGKPDTTAGKPSVPVTHATTGTPRARTTPAASAPASARTLTVAGTVTQTPYGPMQVRLTLAGQKITNVTVLQRTDDGPESDQIDAFALPKLTSETLAAQSAKIDAVSGASYTSSGYIQSLQSALDKASA
jgi:serine/threonine protein kinase